ncbi:hypothetical protein ZIOFF_014736 [Zingiber officinale]|uniref:Uncharacterized protein n=1 Tax=Zingiber officinale TaxID=94328 RepID=A0A8J5HTJ8_ZINOF|nr:hypothetical protein ZIOFF_014736 [Zingiber officinale]
MPSVYQRLDRIIRCSLGSQGECFLYVCLWDQFTLDSRKIMISPLLLLSNNQASRCLPLSQCVSTVEVRTVEEKRKVVEARFEGHFRRKVSGCTSFWWTSFSFHSYSSLVTRLGSSDPKGCFKIGLPSGKSLFQLRAERILSVQKLVAQANDGEFDIMPIHLYIMTSPFIDDATRKLFENRKYFGLEANQVRFSIAPKIVNFTITQSLICIY